MSKTKQHLLADTEDETLGGTTHPCDVDYDYQIARAAEQQSKTKENDLPSGGKN